MLESGRTNAYKAGGFPMSGGSQAWPLQTHLELAALPTAPGCARGHVRSLAHEWGLPGLADTAELLVSELVTNAVQACGHLKARTGLAIVPVVGLWVTSDGVAMVIHVWDPNPETPAVKDFAADDENGRGLFLVETLSKDWGVDRTTEGGKAVWAMITAQP
jgi:anti-sigma regulatory factor (Ser/Thr protein kinase)